MYDGLPVISQSDQFFRVAQRLRAQAGSTGCSRSLGTFVQPRQLTCRAFSPRTGAGLRNALAMSDPRPDDPEVVVAAGGVAR